MLINALVAFVHFLAVFGIVAALAYQWLSFGPTPSLQQARRLAQVDRIYGLSALTLLLAGFARAYHFEKGWAFYSANPFFHLKLGLFIAIGLLSIIPTLAFIRWGAELKAGRAPQVSAAQHRRVRLSLNLQLGLLLPLSLCASLMAKGMGLGF
ncbi:DUF2214 family protein [Roseateles cavernae]|uniref:DUF2214 family protein n=1 Tax=Roseateles cavernae TaxID=3153578 RepID=UPI0032E4D8E0